MSRDTGGPAFARPVSEDHPRFNEQETYPAQEGLSIRDYFAAKVMPVIYEKNIGEHGVGHAHIAEWSYQMADAMLAERAKP